MNKIKLIIPGRKRDLGGFSVQRLLPSAAHRTVGPFIFFDHMGPASFEINEGMDVRPHPHIGLATVTYLFEGCIRHRDSLGSDQWIEPGAINWMTAGRGIVHSERTPVEFRTTGSKINGIQCWVALPEKFEDTDPSFDHYPAASIPRFEKGGVQMRLLVGSALGHKSPVRICSDLFYLEAKMPAGSSLDFAADGREAAVYLVEGTVQVDEQPIDPFSMAVMKEITDFSVTASSDARVLILGGSPVGERHIYWNFVASSLEKINEAKKDWSMGPSQENPKFKKIPGDDSEFIPLP